MTSLISTWPWLNIFPNWPILLMEEIPNNHLGCMKACTWWYKLPIKSYQLCRISSINSITRREKKPREPSLATRGFRRFQMPWFFWTSCAVSGGPSWKVQKVDDFPFMTCLRWLELGACSQVHAPQNAGFPPKKKPFGPNGVIIGSEKVWKNTCMYYLW